MLKEYSPEYLPDETGAGLRFGRARLASIQSLPRPSGTPIRSRNRPSGTPIRSRNRILPTQLPETCLPGTKYIRLCYHTDRATAEADDTCTKHEQTDDLESNNDSCSEYDQNEDPLPNNVHLFEPLDEDADLPSLPVLNSLIFIIGFAVSKLQHDECKQKLTEGANYHSQKYLFMRMKTASNNGKITIPNDCAFEIESTLLFAMEQKFALCLRESKTGIKRRLKDYVSYEEYRAELCRVCFDSVVDRILNTLLGGQTRKIMNNYNRRNAAAARAKSRKGKRKGIAKNDNVPRKKRLVQGENDMAHISDQNRSPISCILCNGTPTKPPHCELFPFSERNQPVHIRRHLIVCKFATSSGSGDDSMFICSIHFTPESFDDSNGKRTLRDDAIPSLNMELLEYDGEDGQALEEFLLLSNEEQQQVAPSTSNDLDKVNTIEPPRNTHSHPTLEEFLLMSNEEPPSTSNNTIEPPQNLAQNTHSGQERQKERVIR